MDNRCLPEKIPQLGMHVHVCQNEVSWTTVELKAEHRSRLLAIAARRGEKGFPNVLGEAVEAYLNAQAGGERRRQKALALPGSLKARDARQLRETRPLRHWGRHG